MKETSQVNINSEEFEVGQWINRREDFGTDAGYRYIVLSFGVYSE